MTNNHQRGLEIQAARLRRDFWGIIGSSLLIISFIGVLSWLAN